MTSMTLKQMDRALARATKKIPFLAVNPINQEKEYAKFFSEKNYNPVFRYRISKRSLVPIKKELKAIRTDDSIMGNIIAEKRDLLLRKLSMIENLSTKKFTKDSIKTYGKPTRYQLVAARKLLKMNTTSSHDYLSADETIKIIRKILDNRELKWKIQKKEMMARAAVRTNLKTLFIKKNAKFSPKLINRLIVHEIGTHVFRSQNGMNQPYSIFKQGFPNYLMTEEGLAVVNEEVLGFLDKRVLKIYAARTIATSMALRNSFCDIYKYLIQYLNPLQAWRITARVKRGLSDTSEPGGFTKDHLYFKGYNELKRFFQKKGDLVKLYYGKIGIEHVHLIDDIPGLVEPKYLPVFSKDELIELN